MTRASVGTSACVLIQVLFLLPALGFAQAPDAATGQLEAQVQDLQKRVRELEAVVLKLTGGQDASVDAAQAPAEKVPSVERAEQPMQVVGAEIPSRSMKLSGLAFGDYYYIAGNHDPSLEDDNGFWLRRVYLTFDKPLSDAIDARARFEMNSAGDFTSPSRLSPFVKDAWLRWKFAEKQEAYVGISPTPTFDKIEAFWPYRAVEKTPLDLQKMADTRDFGLALKGRLGSSEKIDYHVMFANGAGVGGETDHGKKGLFAVGFNPSRTAFLQFTADYEARTGRGGVSTYQGLFGFSGTWGRLSLQYAHQTRGGVPDLELDLFSAFTVLRTAPGVSLVARYDRMFDPNPEGASIAYLPFDPRAKSNLFLLGVDFKVLEELSLIPNIEVIRYDQLEDGSRPVTDVMPRLTFSYLF
ncbi:MAG: hypothetical protein EHM18_01035 [Acidobacteria bacterium]|nr:MAG: hypothetical protein EHM18_01035 [Acidobacteriota bacterium]